MLPGLYLERSNRLELLAARLAELLSTGAPADPLEPVQVVVQTPGVSRWLSMRLAQHLGCCMNIVYPYPRRFVLDMAGRLPGGAWTPKTAKRP
jgi:exodeoxyribonuclease V gamma subunit